MEEKELLEDDKSALQATIRTHENTIEEQLGIIGDLEDEAEEQRHTIELLQQKLAEQEKLLDSRSSFQTMKGLVDSQKVVTRQALAFVAEVTRDEAESNIREIRGYSTIEKKSNRDESFERLSAERSTLLNQQQVMGD